MKIELADMAHAAELESRLLDDLQSSLPQGHNESFTLTALDDDNQLHGGLIAGTSYGWLLIKVLWVAQSHRRDGLGSKLVQSAEDKGRKLGCHAAWLDTSNPQAEAFYRKLGYEEFGCLDNATVGTPSTHKRWFMKKVL